MYFVAIVDIRATPVDVTEYPATQMSYFCVLKQNLSYPRMISGMIRNAINVNTLITIEFINFSEPTQLGPRLWPWIMPPLLEILTSTVIGLLLWLSTVGKAVRIPKSIRPLGEVRYIFKIILYNISQFNKNFVKN